MKVTVRRVYKGGKEVCSRVLEIEEPVIEESPKLTIAWLRLLKFKK
jgi:hypothetical protein